MTPKERIDKIRQIVTEKQFAKIDGSIIDLFSASIIVQVYDGLNDANKQKFSSLTAPAMATMALKFIK